MPLSFPRKDAAGIQPADLPYDDVTSPPSVALLPGDTALVVPKVRPSISKRLNMKISAQNLG